MSNSNTPSAANNTNRAEEGIAPAPQIKEKKQTLTYEVMQKGLREIAAELGITSSDLGGPHLRIVGNGEVDPCNQIQNFLPDSICGPWETLKIDSCRQTVRDNYSPYKLQGAEKENKSLLGQKIIEGVMSLKNEPSADGNPERMLSDIFLGGRSEEICYDIVQSYFDDVDMMSRESLPWHKLYQDNMYLTVEFFRNMAFTSTWLDDSGLKYLLEEMRCLMGEEIMADTPEKFWYLLIKNAINFRRNVFTYQGEVDSSKNVFAYKGDLDKSYWFWSRAVYLQQGLLGDYYPDKMPTPNFATRSSLKEVALIHLKARSFKDLQEKGANTLKWSALNAEMLNTLVRTESIPTPGGNLIVLCHPATPLVDDSGRLPIPKYAAVAVDLSARGIRGKLLFQNDLVNVHGKAVDNRGQVKDSYEHLEVSADTIRGVLLEGEDILCLVSIAGNTVSVKLVAEYCRYLHDAGVDRHSLDGMIQQTVLGPLNQDAQEAVRRLRTIFMKVEGQKPSCSSERQVDDTPIEHADMDDKAKKWRGTRQLLDGAVEISRPTGTEWHEKIESVWKGMIEGRLVTVKLNKESGKLYCDEGKFWRKIRSSDVTGNVEVNIGFGKLGFSGARMFGMSEVDPLRYLVSGSDRRLARMALFAAEKQQILCSTESACYLLHAREQSDTRCRIHIASITASVLNGMDMYYDRKDRRLIVKLLHRFMQLTRRNGKMLHLHEVERVDRESLYLANAEIKQGYKLAGGTCN